MERVPNEVFSTHITQHLSTQDLARMRRINKFHKGRVDPKFKDTLIKEIESMLKELQIVLPVDRAQWQLIAQTYHPNHRMATEWNNSQSYYTRDSVAKKIELELLRSMSLLDLNTIAIELQIMLLEVQKDMEEYENDSMCEYYADY